MQEEWRASLAWLLDVVGGLAPTGLPPGGGRGPSLTASHAAPPSAASARHSGCSFSASSQRVRKA